MLLGNYSSDLFLLLIGLMRQADLLLIQIFIMLQRIN